MMRKILLTALLLLPLTTLRAQVLDNTLQYVPMAAAVGLDFCGVEARHPLRERIALTATAYGALTAVTGGLKLTVHERRPDGSDDRSFPSGHAARAFAGAELVRSEYGWGWGSAAYAVATGVGVLSARAAYWLLPLERKLLGWNESGRTAMALPAYSPDTKSVGVVFTMTY